MEMDCLHKYQVKSEVQDVKPFLLWTTAKKILTTFIVLFDFVLLYVCFFFAVEIQYIFTAK